MSFSMEILILVCTLFIVTTIFRPLWGLWVAIAAAIIYDDRQISETVLSRLHFQSPTIFNIRIAGLQIVDWMLLALALRVLMVLLAKWNERQHLHNWFKRPVVWGLAVATVPYVYSLVIAFALGNPWKEMLQDMQNHGYLLLMAGVSFAVMNSFEQARKTVFWLLGWLSIKTVVLLIRYLTGEGFSWMSVFRVTISSDSILLLILVGAMLFLSLNNKGLWRISLSYLAIASLSCFILFTVAGRTAMVLLFVQIALLSLFIPAKARLWFSFSLFLIIASLILYLTTSNPELAKFYWWRISSIFVWKSTALGQGGQALSNTVKVLEIKNVCALLRHEGALLLGLGQGASWTTKYYQIPALYLNDAYAPGEVKHFSTHLQLLSQLLKMGIMGVVLYWAGIVGSLVQMFRASLRYKKDALIIVSLGMIPLLFNMSNYERLYLFTGLFFGVAVKMESVLKEQP
ncbi:hypothetical protein HZA73_11285 [candidate division TA06 bacterium]|nr:hypothetical protein [candidate division TA06 bacterium]